MKKFTIDPAVFDLFPDITFHIFILKGINNHKQNEDYREKLLTQACQEAQKFLTEETFRFNPIVAEWREIFRAFKTKKGARSTIEALFKRVNKGETLRPINPLVDLYNSASLTYGVPGGGEDIEKIQGNLTFTFAEGGESFFPLGQEESDPALAGELIYKDDAGAVCRNFNWREAQRTMLTEETRDAILIFESVYPEQISRANQLIDYFEDLLNRYFDQEVKVEICDQHHPSITIAD